MALLIDNDIVHKLAQLDLLEQAKYLLQKKYGELQVLNTLRYKYCPSVKVKNDKAVKRYTQEVVSRMRVFIDADISEIDCEITDATLIEAIDISVDGLDIGEMQLLQALINGRKSCMFTGDKRFLKALANSNGISEAHTEKLENSFVCFEQIISYLIKSIGFESVKQKYIHAKQTDLNLDAALRACFGGSGDESQEKIVQDQLQRYVGSLRAETANLLSNSEDWNLGAIAKESEIGEHDGVGVLNTGGGTNFEEMSASCAKPFADRFS